ncbi:MAG TPA: DUF1223 domain-containing protein [Acetobacteraceae bacterium]|nr:DUF1223 domain-containing protein [Acetobacteraceae bacterium]
MHRRHVLIAAAAAPLAVPLARVDRAMGGAPATPVVLELFTSQGCSSCPPADALLGELSRRSGVIALAWHVDYWDRLGWRDPYSSQLATQRQRTYADRLGAEVFTPGLVVDGGAMLVGSDRRAVEAALTSAVPLPVAVTLSRGAEGATARIGGAPGALSALFATWDPVHDTAIGAGENDGRRLREFRIVRSAQVVASWDGAARDLMLPAVAGGQGATVLVQGADLRVQGAAELAPV